MNAPLGARGAHRDRPRSRKRTRRRLTCTVLGLAVWIGVIADPASACDLCAIYTGTQMQTNRTGLRLGVATQVTYFGTRHDGGGKVDNPGESMTSAITQVVLGYNLRETIGAQISLPIISRTFTRLEGQTLRDDDETGIGDMSIVVNYAPFRWVSTDSVVGASLIGGIKLPTGDSDRLQEEIDGVPTTPVFPDIPGRGLPGFDIPATGAREPGAVTNHGGHGGESGLHGHDIALGSGSVDGIVGADLYGSWKRLYALASIQYFIRSQGSYNFQYANDLLWRVGPGAYLALDDVGLGRGYTLGLAALLSGEAKGQDTLSGVEVGGGITALYLGPALTFTWGESLQANLGGELPVLQNTSELQLVPDYRIQAGLTWRF